MQIYKIAEICFVYQPTGVCLITCLGYLKKPVYPNLSARLSIKPFGCFKRALKRSGMAKNNYQSILRSSFSRSLVKILPIRLRLYTINKNPTSALVRPIPFLVNITEPHCRFKVPYGCSPIA